MYIHRPTLLKPEPRGAFPVRVAGEMRYPEPYGHVFEVDSGEDKVFIVLQSNEFRQRLGQNVRGADGVWRGDIGVANGENFGGDAVPRLVAVDEIYR
jgi:hypothetical protein